jgi:hypothetical protein
MSGVSCPAAPDCSVDEGCFLLRLQACTNTLTVVGLFATLHGLHTTELVMTDTRAALSYRLHSDLIVASMLACM